MRVPSKITTANRLNEFMVMKQAQLIEEKDGERVTMKFVEQEAAEFCGISNQTIMSIKKGNIQPSLTTALLLAKYLGVSVEDIFYTKVLTCKECGTEWDGKTTYHLTPKTIKLQCQNCGATIR